MRKSGLNPDLRIIFLRFFKKGMVFKMKNKMAVLPIKGLVWKMGLPMIVSMVLQALYNVVDSVFVANMLDMLLLLRTKTDQVLWEGKERTDQ